jgi:hypothetical protein
MAMNLIFHDLHGTILEVYIDDIVVKLTALDSHVAGLRWICSNVLLECPLASFRVSLCMRKVEIYPKNIESTKKVQAPTCKKELQRFLGKVITWGDSFIACLGNLMLLLLKP